MRKNELAYALERQLFDLGHTVVVLDGASVRSGLSRELDFDPADRSEHLRRVAETAKILNDHGILVIAVFISPRRSIRAQLTEIIGKKRFLEIYAQASLNWCRQHDATGLFAKAEQGNLRFVSGIDIAYEEPQPPDLTIPMEMMSASTAVEQVIKQLREKKFIAVGNPAKHIGWMSRYGEQMPLSLEGIGSYECPHTGDRYSLKGGKIN